MNIDNTSSMDLLSYFLLFHQAYNTHLRTGIDNQSSMDLLVYFLELIDPPRTFISCLMTFSH